MSDHSGVMYVENGLLKYRGIDGNVVLIIDEPYVPYVPSVDNECDREIDELIEEYGMEKFMAAFNRRVKHE